MIRISSKELEAVKADIDAGLKLVEVARKHGRSESFVAHVKQKWPHNLEQAKTREARIAAIESGRQPTIVPRANGKQQYKPYKRFTVAQLNSIKADLTADQLTSRELYRKHGIAKSSLERIARAIREGKFAEMVVSAQAHEERLGTIATVHKKKLPHRPMLEEKAEQFKRSSQGSKYGHHAPRILALREKGLSYRAIADELGITPNVASYYVYGGSRTKPKSTAVHSVITGESNGNGSAINRNILLGVAYAETERFIGVLSERLKVAPDFLRSRLSELLGHSPLR